MKKMPTCMLLILLVVLAVTFTDAHSEDDESQDVTSDASQDVTSDASQDVTSDAASDANEPLDEEKVDYARGSVCGYCTYCKFCQLCDKDCPCVKSKTKPNCHMCKYCKYCYLCSAFCDTICTPGGVLDRVSGAIVNSLPSFSKDEVDGDIDSVKSWIDQKRDEL